MSTNFEGTFRFREHRYRARMPSLDCAAACNEEAHYQNYIVAMLRLHMKIQGSYKIPAN